MTSKKMYLYHSHISTQQSSSIGLLEKKCDLEMTFALFDISSDTCRSPNLEKKQNYILRYIYVSSKGWIIVLKTDIKISKQIGCIFITYMIILHSPKFKRPNINIAMILNEKLQILYYSICLYVYPWMCPSKNFGKLI